MRKGTLDEMMVRVIANLACVRLARLPSWVEVEQGNGFRGGAMSVAKVAVRWVDRVMSSKGNVE